MNIRILFHQIDNDGHFLGNGEIVIRDITEGQRVRIVGLAALLVGGVGYKADYDRKDRGTDQKVSAALHRFRTYEYMVSDDGGRRIESCRAMIMQITEIP